MKLRLPRRRLWRGAIYALSLILVLIVADMAWVESRRVIHPGFDTTRIVAPLKEDGSIDYLLAVDSQFGAGVTPENNAAILALQALGRQAIASYQPADGLTDRLAMPRLPEKGDYFIPYDDYCKRRSVTPSEWTEATSPRPWPVKFDEITSQWVKDNEKPLLLIAEAAKLPRFFIPLYSGARTETMIEIQLRHLSPLRDIGRALRTRALMRLAADDLAGFRADLLTAHRLAHLVGQQSTMIERIVAIGMETSASETERVGIASGKIPAAQARAMGEELAALGDLPSMADSLAMGERYFALDTLQVLARRGSVRAGQLLNAIVSPPDRTFGLPVLFLFVPIPYEEAMRKVNHFEDGALAVLRIATYPDRIAAQKLLERQSAPMSARPISRWDLAGPDWPVQLFAPALGRAIEKSETARMETRLTRIALMLAAYKADHNAYPASLAELAPTYLPDIPNDLFSEKPLIYSRAGDGYKLYSVGPNMIDDGGKTGKSGDDISANLP